MKLPNRATAASLGYRQRGRKCGNVSRNLNIRQTLPSSQGVWSQRKHKYQHVSLRLEDFHNQKGKTTE